MFRTFWTWFYFEIVFKHFLYIYSECNLSDFWLLSLFSIQSEDNQPIISVGEKLSHVSTRGFSVWQYLLLENQLTFSVSSGLLRLHHKSRNNQSFLNDRQQNFFFILTIKLLPREVGRIPKPFSDCWFVLKCPSRNISSFTLLLYITWLYSLVA